MGLEAIIAAQEQISYTQKKRVVNFVIKNECELGVEEQSWKHCLLYMFFSGLITEGEYNN